ncbi:hypothetical protein IC575_013926 [Cucumis melo]
MNSFWLIILQEIQGDRNPQYVVCVSLLKRCGNNTFLNLFGSLISCKKRIGSRCRWTFRRGP